MDITGKLYGIYRAQVVGNKDPEFRGRITVWIPQMMPEIEPTRGLLARPGNNPVGGRNMEGDSEHHFMGTSYIPKKGSWVFIFFEGGDPSCPYYFGACDLENTTVVPECKLGKNPEDKWVIFKSHEGRTIVVSDDPDDERVEITGKKRTITEPPTGDEASVYEIDNNQTTILLDERNGKEKVLIRTYKGDYIHVDVETQNLQIYFKNDISIECGGKFSLKAVKDIHIKTDTSIFEETKLSMHRKAGASIFESAGVNHNTQAGKLIARDCNPIFDNCGESKPAEPADPTKPDGQRKT